MESISLALQPYKDAVGSFASAVTILQMFSGAFVCNDIRKKGSTHGFSAMPFLGGLALCLLFLQHSMLMEDANMIRANLVGFVISMVYTSFFYFYVPKNERGEFWKQCGLLFIFTFGLLMYVKYEDPEKIEYRFGIIVTVLLMILIAMPLFSLGDIMEKKSTEGLPFAMILSGTVVAASWLLYGIILNNSFVIFQNLVGFTLSAIQLSLFAIYPSTSAPTPKTDKKQN